MKKIFLTTAVFLGASILVFNSCTKQVISNGSYQTVQSFEQEEEVWENGGSTGSDVAFCQCVAYIKAILGINTSTANAKDWGVNYTPPGYEKVAGTPQPLDLIVMEPSLSPTWSSNSAFLQYGHIAIVTQFSINNNGDYVLKIKGSNQGTGSKDCHCNNVSEKDVIIPSSKLCSVRFYRKLHPSFACGSFSSTQSNTKSIELSGNLSFGNVLIGNSITLPLTISNNGSTSITVSSLTLPSGYSSDFQSGTISGNYSTTANITFTPTNSVTNYNQPITVNSDAIQGQNSINVTGTAVPNTGGNNPIFSPSIGNFTSCGFGNIVGSGNCNGSTYLGGVIRLSALSYSSNNNSIEFKIEKCNGIFSNSGIAYIKEGGYCGNVIGSTTYNAGSSSINLTITPSSNTGIIQFQAILVSATTDKFYTLPVTVTY